MNARTSAVPDIRRSQLCWIGFVTFVVRSYQDTVRYFVMTIAPSTITMALYCSIFGVIIGHRVGTVSGFGYMQYITPGLIAMPVITDSYSQAALSIVVAKFKHLIDEQLISPLPSWMIVVNYTAGGVVRGLLVGMAVTAIALLLTHVHPQHPIILLGALLLAALVSSLAGFVNGVFAKTLEQANWVPLYVLTPLTYCGGVFYSLALLPEWAQALSRANPLFYLVSLFRYSMLGVADVRVGIAASIICFTAIALFLIAAMLMEKGIGIRE